EESENETSVLSVISCSTEFIRLRHFPSAISVAILACIFHTPKRRVRARGLQERRDAVVGRVPSRGALSAFQSGYEICGLELIRFHTKPHEGESHRANRARSISRLL